MPNAITIEIWYEDKKCLWMTKTLNNFRMTRRMTVFDFYVGNFSHEILTVTNRQIRIVKRINYIDEVSLLCF